VSKLPPLFAGRAFLPSRISPPLDDRRLHTTREPSSPEILNHATTNYHNRVQSEKDTSHFRDFSVLDCVARYAVLHTLSSASGGGDSGNMGGGLEFERRRCRDAEGVEGEGEWGGGIPLPSRLGLETRGRFVYTCMIN